MKSEEEFLKDIYEKAVLLREKEARAAIRSKKFRKLTAGISVAAACVMLAVGVGSMTKLFAAYDGALEAEGIDTIYENASETSKLTEINELSDGVDDDGIAEGTEHKSVYDGSSDSASVELSKNAEKNAVKSAGNSDGMTATDSQGGTSDDSQATLGKGRSGKADGTSKNDGNGNDADGLGSDNANAGDNGVGTDDNLVFSYYCLPARIIIEDTDGNAETATGDAITAVFNEVMKLASEGKAVSAKLAEPVPVESYVKRVIYVTNGTEAASGEAVRLDDKHPNNTVWYIME